MADSSKTKEKKGDIPMPPMSCIVCIYTLGFMDLFAISLILPLLLSHGEQLGASPMMNGLVGSVYGGLQLISSPICGSFSDQYGRARVLIISLLACTVSYLTLAFSETILLLVISRVLAGSFKHTQTMCRMLLVDLEPPSERQRVIGWFNAISSMGFIVGPPIGGHLAGMDGGFRLVTLICAGLFATMFVLSCLLVRDGPRAQHHAAATAVGESLTSFTDVDWLRIGDLMVVRFFYAFSVLLFRANMPSTAARLFGMTPVQFGYLMSMQGVVSAGAGFLTGPIERFCGDRLTELALTSAVFTAALTAASLAPSITWLAVALIPLCACTSSLRACGTALTLDRTPPAHHGLVMGAGQNIASVARLAAPLAAGAAQQLVSDRGPGLVAAACAAIALGVAVYIRQAARSKREKQE
ncbi:major facilitator superfamily domain-containing protein 9-like [Amphibalanus amphitrite]|uniref:major facilitator superfamily domain-containing protein 9-like n=1 Tax=Amphibalanus amphitrite TaxID=1232801 RepID=UPI001C9174B3|nr:major facilitator superfamily domain-containing protein 9-like [Amphibalanus amphitrite]XP_043226608.1 major facilitator superfamily domain-containing protein 9-like [Amphibalanus amphitrite]XP_043226610.1 major facilitator superfamily domain-containing protein 9-like [Amphibalanus amphitrite]